MKLEYPKTKVEWDSWRRKLFPHIPTRKWVPSGYRMIGCSKSGLNVYVVFTNETFDKVWIEKTSSLMIRNFVASEDLVRIDDEEEFEMIHRFFINKGILDGTKGNK